MIDPFQVIAILSPYIILVYGTIGLISCANWQAEKRKLALSTQLQSREEKTY